MILSNMFKSEDSSLELGRAVDTIKHKKKNFKHRGMFLEGKWQAPVTNPRVVSLPGPIYILKRTLDVFFTAQALSCFPEQYR
jgi:hypothetical protein